MTKTLLQKITFKNTKPNTLYELYMDSKKHSIATGAPAKISTKVGGKFSAHGGYISGKNLQLVMDKQIIQSWRAISWDIKDFDSIFIINLFPKGNDVLLEMVHANIPDKFADGIKKGWSEHYWKPWKKYLSGNPIAKSPEM